MSLPPQEPPRGPPSLNVSQKSHKIKKQPPRPSAGTSQSHHPPAPPPRDDYLARLEQQLMSNDGVEVPPLPDNLPPVVVSMVVNTQSVPARNEFPRARVGNMSRAPLQRPRAQSQSWIEPFLERIRIQMLREREQRQQQNPFPLAPAAAASRFLPRTPDSFPAGAFSYFPYPPPPLQFNPAAAESRYFPYPPPQVYFPPTPAVAESSSLPNPPPRFYPVTASLSLPGPSQSFPTAARGSRILRSAPVDPAPAERHSILQDPGNFHPVATGSLPYIPPPAVAGGSSIWYGPSGYFPDNSSSFFIPLPLSEYSPSAASLLPESSPDGTFSPDSTKQPQPPPPDPTA